jgi:hypothetical protein
MPSESVEGPLEDATPDSAEKLVEATGEPGADKPDADADQR